MTTDSDHKKKELLVLRQERYYIDCRTKEIKTDLENFARERSTLSESLKADSSLPAADAQQSRLRRQYVAKRIEILRAEQKTLFEQIKDVRQKIAAAGSPQDSSVLPQKKK